MQASDLLQMLQQGSINSSVPQQSSNNAAARPADDQAFDALWKEFTAHSAVSNRQAPAATSSADQSRSLLGLFQAPSGNPSSVPPPVSSPATPSMQGQALLESLFGSNFRPQTATSDQATGSLPVQATPVAQSQQSAPEQRQIQAIQSTEDPAFANKKSPFEFTSAFDILAAATSAPKTSQQKEQPQESQPVPIPASEATAPKPQSDVEASPKSRSKKSSTRLREVSTHPTQARANETERTISDSGIKPNSRTKVARNGGIKSATSAEASGQSQDEGSQPPFKILQRPKEADIISYGVASASAATQPSEKPKTSVVETGNQSVEQESSVKIEGEAQQAASARLSWDVAAESKARGQHTSKMVKLPASSSKNVQLDSDDRYLYDNELATTPITLFPTGDDFQYGRRLALCGILICYATKQGRLRVLDRQTGARVLLKCHSNAIADLEMHKAPFADDQIQIVSAGSDGRVCIWRLKAAFNDEQEARCRLIAQIHLPEGHHAVLVRHVPNEPSLLVFATNKGAVMTLNMSMSAWTKALQANQSVVNLQGDGTTGALKGPGFSCQHNLSENLRPIDAAFNSTISQKRAITILTKDIEGKSRANDLTVLSFQEEPLKGANEFILNVESEFALFRNLSGINYMRSSGVDFLIASCDNGTRIEIYPVDPNLGNGRFSFGITPTLSFGKAATYGHVHCHEPMSTLLLTNAARGSVFAVKLDPTYEGTLLSNCIEIPTPKRLVDLQVEITESEASLFCIAPDGITQVHFPCDLLETDSDPSEGQMPPATMQFGRRASLENAIQVVIESSTSSLKVETPEPSPKLPPVSALEAPPKKPFAYLFGEQNSRPQSPLQTEVVTAEPVFEPQYVVAQSTPGNAQAADNEQLVQRLLAELQSSDESRRQAEKLAEIARQEELLTLVSTTLGQQTSQTLDASIRSEIRTSLLPEVSKIIQTSIDEEIGRSLRTSLQKSIPDALSAFFNRPDVTNHLVRSFSSAAGPILDRAIHDSMSSVVVPAFTRATQDLGSVLARELRQEILAVRKEMEAEQSLSLSELSENVRVLSETVGRLSSLTSPVARPQALYNQPQQSQHQATRLQQPQQQSVSSQPSPYSSSEGISPSQYEDRLLSALSSPQGSEALNGLLETGSAHLESIFYGNQGRPFLTQAVMLSLAHRLVQSLSSQGGSLTPLERTHLHWFMHCIMQLNENDSNTRPYIPRILQLASNSLAQASARLARIGDRSGYEMVNNIERLVQSKVNR